MTKKCPVKVAKCIKRSERGIKQKQEHLAYVFQKVDEKGNVETKARLKHPILGCGLKALCTVVKSHQASFTQLWAARHPRL